jgi:hypothetical protein
MVRPRLKTAPILRKPEDRDIPQIKHRIFAFDIIAGYDRDGFRVNAVARLRVIVAGNQALSHDIDIVRAVAGGAQPFREQRRLAHAEIAAAHLACLEIETKSISTPDSEPLLESHITFRDDFSGFMVQPGSFRGQGGIAVSDGDTVRPGVRDFAGC